MDVLEIINMVMKDQGQFIKVPTLEPCYGYVGNNWLSLNAKKNPKHLTYSGKNIYCFYFSTTWIYSFPGCETI